MVLIIINVENSFYLYGNHKTFFLSLFSTGSLSPRGSLEVFSAPHWPLSVPEYPLLSMGQVPDSLLCSSHLEHSWRKAWVGRLPSQIIPCAADQCEPLSSCTPYLSSSRKTSLLAHMLLATSIYQGVRAAMLHSLWAAGRGQTQQEVFVWKDAWLRQRLRDG